MREEVEAEYAATRDGALTLPAETIEAIARQFAPPAPPARPATIRLRRGPAFHRSDFALPVQVQRGAAPGAGLRHRDGVAEALRWRVPPGCECHADGLVSPTLSPRPSARPTHEVGREQNLIFSHPSRRVPVIRRSRSCTTAVVYHR